MLNKTHTIWNVQATNHNRFPNILFHNKSVLVFFLKLLNTPSWNQWKCCFKNYSWCSSLTIAFRIALGSCKLRCHGDLFKHNSHAKCLMECASKKWRCLRDKWLSTNTNQRNKYNKAQICEGKPKMSANLEFWRIWVNEGFIGWNEENEWKCLMVCWRFKYGWYMVNESKRSGCQFKCLQDSRWIEKVEEMNYMYEREWEMKWNDPKKPYVSTWKDHESSHTETNLKILKN